MPHPSGTRFFDAAQFSSPPALTRHEQDVLDQLNQSVAAGRSLDEVMEIVFDLIREIAPCDRLSLAFLDDDGRRLTAHWTRALYEPLRLSAGYSGDIHGSSLNDILLRRRPRIINDLATYSEEHPDSVSSRLLVAEGVRSSMTCPLCVGDRVIGILFRSSRKPAAYDDHQIQLHQAMADRLGQSVEKAWLIDQLTRANRSYMEMLGFVSHELKNPLTAILLELGLLSDGVVGALNPEQAGYIAAIRTKADYIVGLIREYLDLARMEGGELVLALRPGVSLCDEVIPPALHVIGALIKEREMNLELAIPTSLPRLRCDPDLIKIVLINFLSNATKYGRKGGRLKLTVTELPAAVRITVWNEGAGFDEAAQTHLFQKFSRLDTPGFKHIGGTGVGLYTCWRIAHLHHGRIGADSRPDHWAEFFIEIPSPSSPDLP